MNDVNWKQYLAKQASLHPSMTPQDVYKLMYQAVYGAEHLLEDEERARDYFQKEFDTVSPQDELLYEQIQENTYRVNLRAWKGRNFPSEWLFKMFVGSVGKQIQQDYAEYEAMAHAAAKEGVFPFSYEAFAAYAQEYKKQGVRAIHHSEQYRQKEKPAYRLVCGEYLRILPILELMAEYKNKSAPAPGAPYVIAVDGRCASGKSTMADMISEVTGAGVVHMDDFFLPMELRTKERLAQPGGNIDYQRFKTEVLPFLKESRAFTYRRFDCSKMKLGGERFVTDGLFYIVEGAYSHHPIFEDYADVKVFSDVKPDVQLERIRTRDGDDMLTMFKERWIPMEEQYFATYRIKENADMIIQ